LYVGRELEIQQLKRDNETLRDYVKTLNQKIELLDSYNYEHSEIK
jgi:cell division protein FtsB